MKPINRAKQKRNYTLLGIGVYLLILYFFLHLGALFARGGELSPEFLTSVFDHCLQQPLDIFPINTEYLTKGLVVGALAPLLFHTEFLRKRDLRPSIESGSAKWEEDIKKYNQKYADLTSWPDIFERYKFLRSIKNFFLKINKALSKIIIIGFLWKALVRGISKNFLHPTQGMDSLNMIFTKEIFLSMDTRKTRRNNNVLVIGGSGTGKSRFLVKPNALQANSSFIFTDPSGELLETLGGFLEEAGYEVRVFNLVQMEHSNCYNRATCSAVKSCGAA